MRKPFKKPKFTEWLQQALVLLGSSYILWIIYGLLISILLVIGRFSPAFGIFSSISSLFVGVGLAKYCDLKKSTAPVNLYWAVNKSIPLAVLAASSIVVFWFIFMALASLLNGEAHKIGQFFLYLDLLNGKINLQTTRELAGWLFSYANVGLIFMLLMLNTFVGWFTHALMLFQDLGFTEAKEKSTYALSRNQASLYKLWAFIFFEALLCSSVTPLLTPVLYVLVSALMFVSYKSIFEINTNSSDD